MFCQNCGAELEMENQRFCQNCGSEILDVSEPPKTTFGVQPVSTPTIPTTPSTPIPVPRYPSKFKAEGEPGKYSKIALGFGIVSLIIGLFTLQFGYSFSGLYFPRLYTGLVIARVIGIIFGIVSVANSNKAYGLEPETSILKAGKGLGIAGLIINAIFLVFAITLM
ncbi:MAG: zinc ribbon domain-containing protein [Candidatus Thorarchaeota archaeon]